MSDITLRLATADDSEAIRAIYACYMDTSITFELEVPSAEAFRARVEGILARFPYIVAEQDGVIVGYAYAGEVMARKAYRWNVEPSIYLAPDAKGKGLGKRLYTALFAILKEAGYKFVYSRVAVPNPASEALHRCLGFVECWTMIDAGFKNGAWSDMRWYMKQLNPIDGEPEEPLTVQEMDPAFIAAVLSK